MITLDFVLGGDMEMHIPLYEDLEHIDVGDICYYLFCGKVTFRLNELDLSTHWGVVPVVDFSSCLLRVTENLRAGKSETFEFTEGEGEIVFKLISSDKAEVRADYISGRAVVSIRELSDAVDRMSFKLLSFLRQNHPDLFRNAEFLDWYRGARAFLSPQ